MFMFVTVGFATWTNRYAQSLGFTPVQGGMIITCYSIAGIIASLPVRLHRGEVPDEPPEFPDCDASGHGRDDGAVLHAEAMRG